MKINLKNLSLVLFCFQADPEDDATRKKNFKKNCESVSKRLRIIVFCVFFWHVLSFPFLLFFFHLEISMCPFIHRLKKNQFKSGKNQVSFFNLPLFSKKGDVMICGLFSVNRSVLSVFSYLIIGFN